MKILKASCFSAGVPGKSVKEIPAGRSSSLRGAAGWLGSGDGNSWLSASKGHVMITSLDCTSSSIWLPLVTETAPCTVPRRVRGLSQTSLEVGFTTWMWKHVLEALTRVLATWMFPCTGTLRGSTMAAGPQAGPVTAIFATELAGIMTG